MKQIELLSEPERDRSCRYIMSIETVYPSLIDILLDCQLQVGSILERTGAVRS